jgi:hypothetical protein
VEPTTVPLPPPAPPAVAKPAFLSNGWRLTLVCGWAAIGACIGLVANTGWILGGSPWWLRFLVVPFVLPAVTIIAVLMDSPTSLRWSWASVVALAAIGLIDVFVAPAMGVAELVLSVVGALVTLAASSGRVPPERSAGRVVTTAPAGSPLPPPPPPA